MANEDQLLTIEEAWEQRVSIPFTRDYVKHTLFSKKKYSQGKKGLITHPHRGLLDQITHVDVRLNDASAYVKCRPILPGLVSRTCVIGGMVTCSSPDEDQQL
jgi:hypothetical protein